MRLSIYFSDLVLRIYCIRVNTLLMIYTMDIVVFFFFNLIKNELFCLIRIEAGIMSCKHSSVEYNHNIESVFETKLKKRFPILYYYSYGARIAIVTLT